MHCLVNRRVRTHEEQFEPFIWKLGRQGGVRGVFLEELQSWLAH